MMSFFFLLGIFVVVSLIMPWVNSSRIKLLENEIQELRNQLTKFLKLSIESNVFIEEKKIDNTVNRQSSNVKKEIVAQPDIQIPVEEKPAPTIPVEEPAPTIPVQPIKEPSPKISFEQRFGVRLPVWIGGIALALSGFFLVKYSIEIGLLTEEMRVTLAAFFGIGLLCLSNFISAKKTIANGKRISQTLAGAAIADLYICVYAATNFYHLVPPFLGFAGMAAVTATAIVMSLRHGMPIAIFGMVGGFLTPALISSGEPRPAVLFSYLYLTLFGLFIVIIKQNWWKLSIPVILAAFAWVAIWLTGGFQPFNAVYLGLFLMAVCATVAIAFSKAIENGAVDKGNGFKLSLAITYLTLGGSTLFMGLIAKQANFGFMEWGLFGLMALGSIVLAYFKQKLYGFAPLITAAACAIMFLAWNAPKSYESVTIISYFALLYIISGYYLMWKSENPRLWAILIAAVSVVYYLIGYIKFHLLINQITWSAVAIAASLLSICITAKIYLQFKTEEKIRQHLLAIFAILSTTFLSISFAIQLEARFLPIVLASQILAISWINNKIDIAALRKIMGILTTIFLLLFSREIMAIVEMSLISLSKNQSYYFYASTVNMATKPLIHFGIPAIEFIIASIILSKQKYDNLVKFIEAIAVILLTVTSYYLIRNIFALDGGILSAKAGFIERGVITNIFCLYGASCLWIGKKFNRSMISSSGAALLSIAMLRIIYFDLMIYNPLFESQSIGFLPIFNGLILPYGLPIAALLFANKNLDSLKNQFHILCNNVFAFILLFTLVSLNVRQLYHGEYLNSGTTSNAETYSYSVAWLLLGVALLFAGTIRKDKMVRISSLCLITLTVGKVFLYDASELTGLYRIFSFLGLGISLITLSWFYTRFISEEKTKPNKE
ncbi:MAG: hypothetical protein K0R25_363 [Rickettsiaceae bacterium]|jgi:hypothetical protein|nr:hypothetical protein [Rickettsiaceae bacterium]